VKGDWAPLHGPTTAEIAETVSTYVSGSQENNSKTLTLEKAQILYFSQNISETIRDRAIFTIERQ